MSNLLHWSKGTRVAELSSYGTHYGLRSQRLPQPSASWHANPSMPAAQGGKHMMPTLAGSYTLSFPHGSQKSLGAGKGPKQTRENEI